MGHTTGTPERALLDIVKVSLNKAMQHEVEPLIQEALKEIEARMRKQMAASLIALVDRQLDVRISDEVVTFRFDRSAL